MGVGIQVIYDPDGDNRDITDKVLFSTVRLESSASAVPGTWQAVVKDVDRNESFTTGKRVVFKLNDQVIYAGFLLIASDRFAFPVVDTSDISKVTGRQFALQGVDYNILFDKRVVHNSANYLTRIPKFTRQWDADLIQTLCGTYLNLPTWLDYTTEVENVAELPRTVGAMGGWVTQGTPWREQMKEFVASAGATYYIKPHGTGARLVWRSIEDTVAPYVLSDKPVGDEQGFRDLDYSEDATGMINDALVWGGNEFTDTGTGTVFARQKNDDSIDDHNRWQWGELHFNDSNYASQDEVDNRADAIVLGRTGDTIEEQNRGLQRPTKRYTLTWFDRNVPVDAGVYQFIYPGDLTTLKLHVFGDGVDPLIVVLPCRSINISFPSLDSSGDAYVQFQGTFSLQLNDPWRMWLAVARRRRQAILGL